jgi:small acid-soluble spore protein I (minor)
MKKGGKRMDLNLRKAILSNIQNNDEEQLKATIVDAIQAGEEKMLPGLGVLFELIWNHSTEQDQEEMIQTLEQGVQQEANNS